MHVLETGPHRAERVACESSPADRTVVESYLGALLAAVTDLVAILVTTVVLGSIYGLVAIGMTLIYGTLRDPRHVAGLDGHGRRLRRLGGH